MENTASILDSYYLETDPRKRKRLLDSMDGSSDPMYAFRKQLYEERYTDPSEPGRTVDFWLFKCVYFPGLYGKRGIFAKPLKKEMAVAAEELHLDQADQLSDQEKDVLYREFRNTASRYLTTCRSDRYGSSFFGMKKASPEAKLKKLGHEFWAITRGLAECADMEKDLDLWCRAFYDELMAQEPACKEFYK